MSDPNSPSIILDEVSQPLLYFLLPRSVGDYFQVNLPEIVHEHIGKWIDGGVGDIYFDAINRKYTFRDAKVHNQAIRDNRYGVPSRDLTISYSVMMIGFIRRSK